MKIHDKIEQGTPEWFALRLGKLTGTNGQAVATNGKGLETLIYEKVAEIITGKMKDTYTNPDMERGNELEAMARNSYELESAAIVTQVGFIELDEYVGCSPDGLIGKDGLLEIKCKNDANFVRYLYDGKIDPDHDWQMQFNLLVSGREWVDYVLFNPNFNRSTVITKVVKDEAKQAKLQAGIDKGREMIKSILAQVNK